MLNISRMRFDRKNIVQYFVSLTLVFYFLSPLSPLFLLKFKKIDYYIRRWLMVFLIFSGFYLFTHQLSGTDIVLFFIRSILMLSFITIGFAYDQKMIIKGMIFGSFVTSLISILYTLLSDVDIYRGRLSHPFMTSTSLGIIAAFGCVAMFYYLQKYKILTLPLFITFLVVILSGSRSALIFLGMSFLVVIIKYKYNLLKIFSLAAIALCAILLAENSQFYFLNRLISSDSTSRNIVWYNSISSLSIESIMGHGMYQLGSTIGFGVEGCSLWSSSMTSNCPVWLERLSGFWIYAHNGLLQSYFESGILGVLGLLMIISMSIINGIASKQYLAISILIGLLFVNSFDNTWIVPSAGVSEMFWIVIGICLKNFHIFDDARLYFFVPISVYSILFLPFLTFNFAAKYRSVYSVYNLAYPKNPTNDHIYDISFSFVAQDNYDIYLNICNPSCKVVDKVEYMKSNNIRSVYLNLITKGLNRISGKNDKIQIIAFKSDYPFASRPLLIKEWAVEYVK